MFAALELYRMMKAHMKLVWCLDGKPNPSHALGLRSNPKVPSNPSDMPEGPNETPIKPASTLPSQWPQRHKIDWKNPALMEAYKKKALCETSLAFSEAVTDVCQRIKQTDVAAEMLRVTSAIREAKQLRERQNAEKSVWKNSRKRH
jgi:hypothetical protein